MTTTEPRTETTEVLTDEMLARFDERAPTYDRENRFFAEDFDELRESGYLSASLPTDLGGAGLSLSEVNRLQRRLAYHAPATALGEPATNDLFRLAAGVHICRIHQGAPGFDEAIELLIRAGLLRLGTEGHGS